MVYYVLVGGDAAETQGEATPPSQRELLHTSLPFIGRAYQQLREAGVPRERIIVIAQVEDYLNGPVVTENAVFRENVVKDVALLLEEGGCDYDGERVNPATLWCVLLGMESARFPKVIPRDSKESLVIAVYSHGDSHPSTAAGKAEERAHKEQSRGLHRMSPVAEAPEMKVTEHEWFFHLPYSAPSEDEDVTREMNDFIAFRAASSAGFARNRSRCYFYATHLKVVLARLFHAVPDRPIVTLLNYCRSGGALHFIQNEVSKSVLGASNWPLMMICSSQAEKDALVGGMWTPFFELLSSRLSAARENADASKGGTLGQLYRDTCTKYRVENVYELRDIVLTFAYASNFGDPDETFASDLTEPLCSGVDGRPNAAQLRALQETYRNKSRFGRVVYVWNPVDWGTEVDLVQCCKQAEKRVAIPDMAVGDASMMALPLHRFVSTDDQRL